MQVEFINKAKKEYNSLTSLVLSGVSENNQLTTEIPFTEKELSQLLRSLYNMRQDIFESEGLLENEDDKKSKEELEAEVERLRDIIDDIRCSANYD